MNESERRSEDVQQQKAKIRRRYRGIDLEKVRTIPVTVSQPDFYDDSEPKRVAVYARVSTGDPRQTSSYELQRNYYEKQVKKHPNWTLVSIYADEGLSGTSTQKRKEFNRMIEDCRAGKIDLILTKSISRFARNYIDCGQIVRELMDLKPPVGIRFESENIFTLKMEGEMGLALFSSMAQEESRIKSNAMNASIEMRFGSGIFLTPPLLGYDQDEEGNLIINKNEAKIVRLIFFLYLFGYTCQQIADTLTQLKCPTKKGNEAWSAGSVLRVLRNERHCGAVRARKTFTPNYLNHRAKKNRGERLGYFAEDHHEPIISPEDYFAAQKLLSNAKYGGRGILPELHTVPEGLLKGFVAVNPRWAGFGAEEYRDASLCVHDGYESSEPMTIEVQPGDFDLRGFEMVPSQFFRSFAVPYVSISTNCIRFSRACIQRLEGIKHVELLVHPGKMMLAVRPADDKTRHAVRWTGSARKGGWQPKSISGAAFIPTLYQMFAWNTGYKYCVQGVCRRNQEGAILLFYLRDAEILIPDKVFGGIGHGLLRNAARRAVIAFPPTLADKTGDSCYARFHSEKRVNADAVGNWRLMASANPPCDSKERDFTASDDISDIIQELIPEVRREDTTDGG